ncbi:hypothetical protein BLA24_18995 [Streptomyces cinnamoneus]|uniref:M23ase beta-sheet core domain-containing protein n=1 Tax=Streptomyces cinnamoneus TaxID=53446 RepID=A0A2G1XHX1_STRCJ|nr:peptidoglycan DD-metalloendopeptidase family protein [Streptomyces cinnamoneus]PHQ50842.1 hypothetical protein BLA24_18995 [Streptomyces cinnamoneus]PPT13900.1 peptidase [Streptomyces cinnamoneus]
MASNGSGFDGSSYEPHDPYDPYDPSAEWNPAEETAAPSGRGRHRVVKQRGGTVARGSAVLGVGVIAAVGAGGMASAQDRPAAPISVPDLVQGIPGVGALIGGGEERDSASGAGSEAASGTGESGASDGFRDARGSGGAGGSHDRSGAREDSGAGEAGVTVAATRDAADAGEVLRARILQQAERQQAAAEEAALDKEAHAAAETHRKAAAERVEAFEAERAEAEAEAEAAAARVEKEEAQAPVGGGGAQTAGHAAGHAAPGKRQAAPASGRTAPRGALGAYTLPVGSYTLTAGFGQAGNMWSANHTGEDFAAPTGTPVKAVGGGTVTQAGWAGAYGYRIVLTLDDGTQLWYCHLSSMVVTSGKVAPGTVIGRVGATGNVTGPHLHLEVRPGGGAPVDPLSWLRGRGLQP